MKKRLIIFTISIVLLLFGFFLKKLYTPNPSFADGVALHYGPSVTLYVPVTTQDIQQLSENSNKSIRLTLVELSLKKDVGLRVFIGTEEVPPTIEDMHYVASITGGHDPEKPTNYLLNAGPTLRRLSGCWNLKNEVAITLTAIPLRGDLPEHPFCLTTVSLTFP